MTDQITAESARILLFDSPSLTDEADELVIELMQWIMEKRRSGNRPIPVTAALRVAASLSPEVFDSLWYHGDAKRPLAPEAAPAQRHMVPRGVIVVELDEGKRWHY